VLYVPMLANPDLRGRALVNIAFTSTLLVFIVAILVGSALRWSKLLRAPAPAEATP